MAEGPRVHPVVALLAAYAWRLLAIAAAAALGLWLVGELSFVLVSLVVVVFATQLLNGPAGWLRRHGWRPGLAAAAVLVGFVALLVSVVGFIGLAVVDEADQLGGTLTTAVDDVGRWLVEDSPFDVEPEDVQRFRDDAASAIRRVLRSSSGAIVSGAVAAAEAVAAVLVGLIVTFFALKDGERFVAWTLGLLPERHRALGSRLGARSWRTIGGYLRGAATLGVIEGTIIAVTLAIVGSDLAVPVGTLTFLAAFIPFVGAIIAGVVAVLVALADVGTDGALVVAVVALIVQQVDNELLAPVVYGRMLALHPVAVLLAVATGGALFGLPGSFLAVPVTAVAVGLVSETKAFRTESP